MREHMLRVDGVNGGARCACPSMVATGLPVVTAHVVVADSCFHDGSAVTILDHIRSCVASHFEVSVEHPTFQLETAELGGREPASIRHP